jgi:FPC/CPF motif-containing protein YcgG
MDIHSIVALNLADAWAIDPSVGPTAKATQATIVLAAEVRRMQGDMDTAYEFIRRLGFDPNKVVDQLRDDGRMETTMHKSEVLRALHVERDFTRARLSEYGVAWAKEWLDSLSA